MRDRLSILISHSSASCPQPPGLCIDGVPTVKNKSKDDVLDFTKLMFKEGKVALPDNVLDQVYRIGPAYTDRMNKKSIIFYRAKKNLKKCF